ncbi:Nardilysin [Holothuria leucospilota]|uniref:Nardilysin n=1 Tax=Holothuria leucospilota TaxID=206669 RepID=A0A9Q1HBD6_HOLLE|nr:Nardilysin [Holothuria leucospilota]
MHCLYKEKANAVFGNTESIKTKPSLNGINVYERLRDFREKNYSSHYMTLVVQSQETLDVLEDWITSTFSDIPNNKLEKISFDNCGLPFHPEKFQKLYKVVPVKNYHQIEVTWAFPPLAKYYKSKPLQYLGWLVGHEGNGSLLALLKKRSLALSLYAGNVESGFEHNSTYSSFGVMVTLTDEGLEKITEVVKIIFQYIKMLQDAGPNERIYNEIKTIDDNDFRFHEEEEPIELVETLAENMQIYPDEHILTGHLLKFEYDEEIYAQCTKLMTIDKANFILYSKTFADECTKEEYWYKTKYSVSEVPQEWISMVANAELNPELHLPAPNNFIATNFALKEADREDTEYPVCILDAPHSKIWYKRDTKFKTPRGYIYFHLITPVVNENKTNLVLFDFMVSILEHNLSEVGYDADVADLQYIFKTEETGLVMKVNGFNHKLPDLFQTLVDYLAGFTITVDLFTSVKQSMTRSYYNHNITKSSLNTDVRLSILQEKKCIPIDKATVVNNITREQVMDFAVKFKEALYLEGLVQGNFTSKEALGFEEYLRKKLGCQSLSSDRLPAMRVVQLRNGHHICRVKGLGPVDKNTVVTNYYQWGPGTVEKYSLLNALVVMMEEPCFDVLRTQEQLGYSVHATCRNTFGVLGFSVTVTTQATKFSASHVDGRIDQFLQHFHDKILASLPEDVFWEQIQGLINLKMCADLHLGEEVKRNWFEVKDQSYVFDRSQREVNYLKKLTLEDVKRFLAENLKNGQNCRKLSVQVIGAGKFEQFNLLDSDREAGVGLQDMDEVDASSQEGKELTNLKLEMLPLENGYSGHLIEDITSFKQGLMLYPLSKLNH